MEGLKFEMTNPVDVCTKELTENDVRESSRLYIGVDSARQICPQAFQCPPNNDEFRQDLVLYDVNRNALAFRFHKRKNKYYLEKGWKEFLQNKRKRPGDVLKIQKYKEGTEEIFLIGFVSELFLGALTFPQN